MDRKACHPRKRPHQGGTTLTFLALLSAVIASSLSGVKPTSAAVSTWTQTDWSGGADGGVGAAHPADQGGWTKYASVNGMSGTASPGNAVLPISNFSATDDGTLTTTGSASGGGFGNGTTSGMT